jgi:hypothetical protein
LEVSRQSDASDTKINEDYELVVGKNEAAGVLTVTANYDGMSATATVTVFANSSSPSNPGSLKEKFGIDTQETEAVKDTFTALHNFIQAGGLTNPNTREMIKLGDWIDLDGGLEIAAYGTGDNTGGFSSSEDPNWNNFITVTHSEQNYQEKLNRLIVVGINSFKTDTTVNENYIYPGNDTPPPHVVFQFKNIPVSRRMNALNSNSKDTNKGGYPASEMRRYLTELPDDDKSGSFLDGLKGAGVPKDVLWGPSRAMTTNGNGIQIINDLLWLPTEYEMLWSYLKKGDETEENQPTLKYYTANSLRRKFNTSKSAQYWLASADCMYSVSFLGVNIIGTTQSNIGASKATGVAPAFCVY